MNFLEWTNILMFQMKMFCKHNPLIIFNPDSPGAGRRQLTKKNSVVEGLIDPERDIYAIPSQVTSKSWK